MSDEATPKPIDFSALDPSRNQLRWERTIDNLAAHAYAERRRRLSVEYQLLRWGRPVLAAAAAVCLILWSAGYFAASRRAGATATASAPPALVLATWAANHQTPETDELLGTLGANHE
jgi:hypothetical protein